MENKLPAEIDIDAIIGQAFEEDADIEARKSIYSSVGADPNRHAEVLRLSEKTKIPTDVVDRNFDAIKKKDAIDSVDIDAILREAPEAKKWLSDPDNAKLVSDDFSTIGRLKKNITDLPKSFEDSLDTQELIQLRGRRLRGEELTPEEAAKADLISQNLDSAVRGTGGFLSDGLQDLTKNSVQMVRSVAAGGIGAAAGYVGGGIVGGAGGALVGGPAGAAVGSRVGSKIGARIGGGAAAYYENFDQQSALVYDDMLKIRDGLGNKLDDDTARGTSIAVGVINSGLELVGLGKLLETIPGLDRAVSLLKRGSVEKALEIPGLKQAFARIGKRFVKGVVFEGFSEGGEEITQIIGEEFVKARSEGNFRAAKLGDSAERVGGAVVGGMGVATVIGGAGSTGAAALELRRKRGLMPDQVATHIDTINQAARESTLYQKSPERFNTLVQSLSPDERFYVNGEAALQAIEAMPEEQRNALFNAIPDLRTELENASISDADVAIRKADYVSYIAPFPQADALRDYIKLDPADMSVAERNAQAEFIAKNPEAAQQIKEQVGQIPPDTQDMIPAIERIVRKAMKDAGLSSDEAKSTAPLYARTLARFSAAFGQNGMDNLNKGLLEFQTVDEAGNPITTGSNFSVMLNDLAKVRAGEKVQGLDDAGRAAVEAFGNRLDAAGIDPAQAQKMSSKEILDQLYPMQQQVQVGDQVVTMPEVAVSQTPDGNVSIEVKGPDVNETTLRQRYESPARDGNITETPEFKAWFGDSKVVDENGDPLVVYHGTAADITEFDPNKAGFSTDAVHGKGMFFSSSSDTANQYADNAAIDAPVNRLKNDDLAAYKKIQENRRNRHIAGQAVYPAFLKIENPIVIDAGGKDFIEFQNEMNSAISDAKKNGNDGVIFKNLNDNAKYKGEASDQYFVFKPEQIKSIFNAGTFDPSNPNILQQPERGFIQFTKSKDFAERLRGVVVAFTQNKNFSTSAHEFSHWGVAQHRMFAEMARTEIANGNDTVELRRITDDWEALKKEVGATDDRFTVDQEEKIARMFENYMREGNAPSETLRRVFARFRDWLTKIYKDVRQLNAPLNDEMRGIFDRWLASEDEISNVQNKNGALAEIAQTLDFNADIIKKISDRLNSAKGQAEDKIYRELTREQRKRETQAYRDELAKMKAVVAGELGEKREYKLTNYLKANGLKIYAGPETDAVLGEPSQQDIGEGGTPPTLAEIEAHHREGAEASDTKQSLIEALMAKPPKEPVSLLQFLRSKGGLKDYGGELKALGDSKRLINNKSGVELDRAREAAVEAGYLIDAGADPNRPSDSTVADLLDAIDRELRGEKVYSQQDEREALAFRDRQELEAYADQYGITSADIEQARADARKYGAYAPLFTTQADAQGAVDPSVISDLFAYDSPNEMLRTVRNLPNLERVADREARKRLLSKYPDMIESGRIQNRAVEAIYNDQTLLALDLIIRELGRARGDNSRVGMKEFAQAMAQQQVAKMKMSEASYSFRYDIARETEMRKALQASRVGKTDEAMMHLQRAMVNQVIYKQLEAFTELRSKAGELFKRVDKKDKDLAPSKDMDFIGAARYILNKYGLGGEAFDIKTWMEDIQQRDPNMMQDLIMLSEMVDAPEKAAKDLTISEFKDVYNAIKNIYSVANNLKEFEINGKKMRTEMAVAELVDQIGPITKPLHDSTQITGINQFRDGISSAKAALRRVELWAKSMDAGGNGPFTKYIWKIANDAEDAYKTDRSKWLKGYRDILSEHKEQLNQRGRIDSGMVKTDALGRQSKLIFKDRMELIGFLMHTGNESNLDKLLGGYGIEREQFEQSMRKMAMTGQITKRDVQLVQKLWNYAEDLKPIAQQAHRKLYGFRFDEIESSPITFNFPDGDYTVQGGYWPAIADTKQAANSKSVEQMLEQTRQYMLATVGKGFTKSRVQQYKQPLKTDLRLGSQHIDKVLRFVHLEPATRDISRIINRKDFREAMKAVDFDAVDGMLMPWLQRFSQQTMEPMVTAGDRSGQMGHKILNYMRSAAMSQIMRYNPVVAVQNFANLPIAGHLIGYDQLAKSFAAVTVNPINSFNEMKAASKMMSDRFDVNAIKAAQEIDQLTSKSFTKMLINDKIFGGKEILNEKTGAFIKGRDFMLRHGFIFMRAIDSYLSSVVWHGAYNKNLIEGGTDSDAIAYADSIVRQVMGASGSKDVSKIEASSPMVKAIMPFYSYFNAQANLVGTEFGNIMKEHGWAGSPKMFMAYVSLIAAPALLGELITGALRDKLPEDDDDDGILNDWLAWATQSQLKYMAAAVPIAGQGVNAVINRMNDNPMDDRLSVSPVISALDTLLRAGGNVAKELDGGDVKDSRMIRDVMSGLGFVMNVPLGQVSKPISYIVEVEQGEITPESPLEYMQGLVVGPPPKK